MIRVSRYIIANFQTANSPSRVSEVVRSQIYPIFVFAGVLWKFIEDYSKNFTKPGKLENFDCLVESLLSPTQRKEEIFIAVETKNCCEENESNFCSY